MPLECRQWRRWRNECLVLVLLANGKHETLMQLYHNLRDRCAPVFHEQGTTASDANDWAASYAIDSQMLLRSLNPLGSFNPCLHTTYILNWTDIHAQVADAFPLDSFNQPLPQRTADVAEQAVLKKPPKWLRRPVGACFTVGSNCSLAWSFPVDAMLTIFKLLSM